MILASRALQLQALSSGIQKKYGYRQAESINVNLENKAKQLFGKLGLRHEKIPTLNHNQNLPRKIEGVYKKDNLTLRKNARVSDKKAEAVAMHEIYHHTQKDKGLELGQEEAQANMIEKAYLNENQETSQEPDFDLIYAYTIKQFYEHEELEQLVRLFGGDAFSARRVYSNAMEVIAESRKQGESQNSQQQSNGLKKIGDSGVKYKKSEEKFSTSEFIGPMRPSKFIGPVRPTVDYSLLQSKVNENSSSFPSGKIEEATPLLQSISTKKIINKKGIVVSRGGVNLRHYPSTDTKGVKKLLIRGTLLDIKYMEDDFYFVNTVENGSGYITTIPGFISMNLPVEDKINRVYLVEKNDTLLDISKKYYTGLANKRTDHNHYVDALVKYNNLQSKDEIQVGQKIKIPPMSTLKKYIVTSLGDEIEGVVGEIIDFVMIVVNFHDGVISGATQSIIDLVSIPIDIINSIIALIKEIWNLTLLNTIVDTISKIINTDWIEVLKKAGQAFIEEWNGMSNNERSYLIGQIIGYLAMEALMLYLGKQAYLKFKLTGLGIKLVALMKRTSKIDELVGALKKNPKLNEIKNKLNNNKDNNQNISENEIKLEPGKKGSWNAELNQVLEPNKSYQSGNKVYKTDNLGRVKSVEGKLELKTRDRNTYQQTKSGKEGGLKDAQKDDEGGHLIASRFDGAGEQINYLPMNANLNRGEWKKMENLWAKNLELGKEVKVNIQPIYNSDSKRPSKFKVIYEIDGIEYTQRFKNKGK